MKVLIPRKRWTDDNQPLHVVEKKKWTTGDSLFDKMLKLMVLTWCGKKIEVVAKGDQIEPYDKDVHKSKLCKECVRMVKLQMKHKQSSLKTESETKSN